MALISGVTTDDVLRITGKAVTTEQLAQALAVIELYASVDLSDFMAYAARNRKWLQAAVAYQAAWMAAQPDVMTRTDFVSQSQDGLSFTTRDDSDLFLAPLAQKALSRVTWVRPRTVMVSPGRQTRLANRVNNGFHNGMNDGDLERVAQPGMPVTDADFDAARDGAGWL